MNHQARHTQARCTMMLAISLLALVGCSSVRPVINTSPVIAVVAMSGTPQAHEVNGVFGSPLVAMVTNNGSPAAGVVVTFTAPTTGASGTFANSGSTTKATTNASGLATTALFTANGTAGTYAVNALASGATTPASFTLTNTIGAPATIKPTSGMTQSAPINTAFAPFMVTVVDGGGNPISNAVVTFTASTLGVGSQRHIREQWNQYGNGYFLCKRHCHVIGIHGEWNVWQLHVECRRGYGFCQLTLTNSAGAPATITATSSTPQNTQIGTPFSAPLVATVLDSLPNPVNGIAVTFTAPASGASGTFTDGKATETDTTNSAGVATSTFHGE